MPPAALLLPAALAAPLPALPHTADAALAAVPAARVVRPGHPAPGTPPDLNVSITVRYGNAARPRAVLVLVPGFLGGASGFDRLARQIVALDPTLAVWAVDRRANALEPQDVFAAATPDDLRRLARDGLPPRDPRALAFLTGWGLDTTLRDLRAAVREARALAPRVVLGGHSLGATLAAQYAAYDFDGEPGFRDLAGLLLLDGAPGAGPAVTRAEYENGVSSGFGRSPGLRDLPADPYVRVEALGTLFFGPERAARAAATARLAALDPDAPFPGGPTFGARLPATNLAAAMLQVEGRYALFPFAAVTTGRVSNATEALNLPAVLLQGGRGLGSLTVFRRADRAKPVGWRPDPAAPTDAPDFVERYWTPQADFTEWYFPRRLLLDVGAAGLGTRGTPFERDLPVWHLGEVDRPILAVAGGNGLATEAAYRAFAARTRGDLRTLVLPGYAHLDVLAGRSDTLAREVLGWLGGR